VIQPNNELSTGLYPVKEVTQEEKIAVKEMEARLGRDAKGLDARVAAIEAEAAESRKLREQPVILPSPRVLTMLAEDRAKRRGY
jgi:hypothetical protein